MRTVFIRDEITNDEWNRQVMAEKQHCGNDSASANAAPTTAKRVGRDAFLDNSQRAFATTQKHGLRGRDAFMANSRRCNS